MNHTAPNNITSLNSLFMSSVSLFILLICLALCNCVRGHCTGKSLSVTCAGSTVTTTGHLCTLPAIAIDCGTFLRHMFAVEITVNVITAHLQQIDTSNITYNYPIIPWYSFSRLGEFKAFC